MTQTPPGNGATPDTGQPATGTPPGSGETPPAQLPQSIDDALKQIESLQAALKKTNAESASHRHKLKAFEDAQAKAEAEKLTETEKLQKQIAEMQAAREADVEDRIADKIRLAAAAMGFNQKILHRIPGMLKWEDLDYDEKTGMPTNVDKLLKELKEEFQDVPGFFSGGRTTSGGATNPSRSASSRIGEITRDNLTEAMKPENFKDLSEAQKQLVYQMLTDRY